MSMQIRLEKWYWDLFAPDKILHASHFAKNRGRHNSGALPYPLIPLRGTAAMYQGADRCRPFRNRFLTHSRLNFVCRSQISISLSSMAYIYCWCSVTLCDRARNARGSAELNWVRPSEQISISLSNIYLDKGGVIYYNILLITLNILQRGEFTICQE